MATNRRTSEESDCDMHSEDEIEEDINDYYNNYDDLPEIDHEQAVDPEAFDFQLLKVRCFLNFSIVLYSSQNFWLL